MIVDLVRVDRVDAVKTALAGVMSYTITGNTVEDVPRIMQYQTTSDWKASLCQEAKKSRRLIWLGWIDEDPRFKSRRLVKAEINATKWSPE